MFFIFQGATKYIQFILKSRLSLMIDWLKIILKAGWTDLIC